MKSKTVVWTSIVSLTLASGAFAGVPGTYASGLQHLPLGGVLDLTVDGRKLTACCLGSSGEDGVEVRFDSLWGGGVGVDLTPLLTTAGSSLDCVSKGWDGTVKGVLHIEDSGGGSLVGFIDFTESGAIGVRTITYGPDGQVVSDVETGGPVYTVDQPVCPPPGVPTWWQTSGGWWVFGCGYGLDPYGDPYPYARAVSPVFPGGLPLDPGVSSIEFTGISVGELELGDANIGTFGVSSWGLGQAHISEQCDVPGGCAPEEVTLVADNLGSSGLDGVAIDLGGNAGGASVQRPKCCRGHVIIMKAFDDEEQEMMRAQTSTDPDPNVPGETLDVDFSAMGATDVDVEFFDNSGQLLASYPIGGLPFGGWMSGMCPPGCSEIWEQNWYSGRWTFVRCDCLTGFDFVLNTGAVVNGVYSIGFTPHGAGNPLLRRLEFTTDDSSDAIAIGDVMVTARCPGNLNGDGQVNLADLAALLAHYGTTTGALPQDGDLDDDGDVDLADLAGLLSAYGTTCP